MTDHHSILNSVQPWLDRVTDRPETSLSLPAACYIEPAFLAIEHEEIFARSWQFLCHGEKLREVGAYVTGQVAGRSVFAVRGKDGIVRAFYNTCRHRAHELVRDVGKTQALTCPYHAWSFNLDGSLRAAPGTACREGFEKADFALLPIQVEEFAGLYFVNLDPGAAPLHEQSGALKSNIEHYAPDLSRLTLAYRLTYSIKANWKAVVDNFLECSHCPVAHRDFCSLIDMDTYQVENHGLYISHMAKARSTADNTAYRVPGATVDDHAVYFLWPNMALMRYPGRGNFMVWRFIPDGPESTREEFEFYFETDTPSAPELEAIRYIDEVLQVEDINIVESVQRGMHSPGFRQGPYLINPAKSGLSEHGVHHFHSLLAQAYRARFGATV